MNSINPAEQHVDAAQRAQAMEFLQKIMGAKAGGGYTPILKALKQIGITPKTMPVMIGDEPEDCLVIPVSELMSKEWKHMSELDEIKEQLGGPNA